MHDRLVLRGMSGEEYILTSWMDASPFQRACAVDPHHAPHLFEHLIGHRFEDHRLGLLSLTAMDSVYGTHRMTDHEVRKIVLDQLARSGQLILVDEGLHVPPCGVGQQPHSVDHAGPAAGGSEWAGDSSKWTQEKKLLSMHPELRPLVKEVVEGLTKRGFQPIIFFGWRSVAVQLEIYKKHHTKVKFSFHNVQKKNGTPDAYAADIIDKRWAWSNEAKKHGYWTALGEEAKKQKLYWGGDWKKPDWAHVQLVPNSQLKHYKAESGL
jgi:hypothetical protein